jgi:hypothetical protein
MKAQRWSRGTTLLFSLTSALDGVADQLHAPAALPPGKKTGNHFMGRWVGPGTGAENLALHRDSIPGPSSP